MQLYGRFKGRDVNKCPRCGEKCLKTQPTCHECGLIFSRLESCTNKAAVLRLKRNEKQNVIMSKKIPPDKNFWVLLLYAVLGGLFGMQYFYVYRWKMGVYMLASILLTSLIGVYFNAYFISWHEAIQSIFIIYVGVYSFVWLNSIIQVIFKKFKIPVSLPYKEFKLEDNK